MGADPSCVRRRFYLVLETEEGHTICKGNYWRHCPGPESLQDKTCRKQHSPMQALFSSHIRLCCGFKAEYFFFVCQGDSIENDAVTWRRSIRAKTWDLSVMEACGADSVA